MALSARACSWGWFFTITTIMEANFSWSITSRTLLRCRTLLQPTNNLNQLQDLRIMPLLTNRVRLLIPDMIALVWVLNVKDTLGYYGQLLLATPRPDFVPNQMATPSTRCLTCSG